MDAAAGAPSECGRPARLWPGDASLRRLLFGLAELRHSTRPPQYAAAHVRRDISVDLLASSAAAGLESTAWFSTAWPYPRSASGCTRLRRRRGQRERFRVGVPRLLRGRALARLFAQTLLDFELMRFVVVGLCLLGCSE